MNPPIYEACLIAAEQVQRKLMSLGREIERSGNPSVRPKHPLPVDVFLGDMLTKVNAPRIILKPRRLKDKAWTESLAAYVYAGIEKAFIKAGKLPGGNQPGHKLKLNEALDWVEQQALDPGRAIPEHFVQKTTYLFQKGILEDRRRERIAVILRLGYGSLSEMADLSQLKKWIQEDLADTSLRQKGRPADYQKIVFAAEVANLWNALTGRPISRGPATNFAKFVTACWDSGFVGMKVNSNFKRTIRYHIEESGEPYTCGRCDKCQKFEKCERKRYFGILL